VIKVFELIIWAFIIVQQPSNNSLWVSQQTDTVTHWTYIDSFGSYSLLADESLAGQYFPDIKIGNRLFANGFEYVVVDKIFYTFEWDESNIFSEVYAIPGRLILQTDYQNGRIFVIGLPTGRYNQNYVNQLALLDDAPYKFMMLFPKNLNCECIVCEP